MFDNNWQWRKDAWNRIENIRKGDINVIVKDSSGNPINGAEVNVNMYEHEFQWGTAINRSVLSKNTDSVNYRAGLSSLFNSVVLESAHKWTLYEEDPTNARQQINMAKALGIKYLRGHALMWDRPFENDIWVSNSTIPQDLFNLYLSGPGNKAALDTRIQGYISDITGAFKNGDKIVDWDVLNEPLNNHAILEKYGGPHVVDKIPIIKQWFDWARLGAGKDTQLYINETAITGNPDERTRLDWFKTHLSDMVAGNVDFDGIGIQGHFINNKVSPEAFYDYLAELAAYDKEMKVTEFDMSSDLSADREYEASFMRDVMIAAFSLENINGFTTWGFWSGSHWLNNAPIYNADWSLKDSGKQYIDLVYNKWWTQESGATSSNGKYSTVGYYGDYDITVSANGKTKTIEARCYKGQNNTITITLD